MTAIQDLVPTFCPKMRCVPQRILKLLMPVLDLSETLGSLQQLLDFWVGSVISVIHKFLRTTFLLERRGEHKSHKKLYVLPPITEIITATFFVSAAFLTVASAVHCPISFAI